MNILRRPCHGNTVIKKQMFRPFSHLENVYNLPVTRGEKKHVKYHFNNFKKKICIYEKLERNILRCQY